MINSLNKLKRAGCLALISSVLLSICLSGCSKNNELKVLDSDGKLMATVAGINPLDVKLEKEEYSAYVECAVNDAVELIKSKKGCKDSKAQQILLSSSAIKTYFDKDVFNACDKVYRASDLKMADFAFVLCNRNGEMLCAYSSERDNFTLNKTQPYSSFKPLSVYAPAIESGVVNYSTVFPDKPVKKVLNANGEYVDWPKNAQNTYQNENVTIADGIKLSLNTTAVNCLMKSGVKNSIDFLEKNFNIDVAREKEIMNATDEDEVLSSIGLGYLKAGVSPVDMAGYYEIFINDGNYVKPSAVNEIIGSDNSVTYSYEKNEKKVISSETAYIMNKLLQNTLEEGGTAHKASCEGVAIGGKTGTGESSVDNWFVGFSPEYTFSVWHGQNSLRQNKCAELFSLIAKGIEFDKNASFTECDNVVQMAYCTKTGKLLGLGCIGMEVGYYKKNNLPEKCDSSQENI